MNKKVMIGSLVVVVAILGTATIAWATTALPLAPKANQTQEHVGCGRHQGVGTGTGCQGGDRKNFVDENKDGICDHAAAVTK